MSCIERLFWERGRGGVARLDDVQIQLPGHRQPDLVLPMPVLSLIDYSPADRCAQLQPEHGGRRDMDGAERTACAAFLHRICDVPTLDAEA